MIPLFSFDLSRYCIPIILLFIITPGGGGGGRTTAFLGVAELTSQMLMFPCLQGTAVCRLGGGHPGSCDPSPGNAGGLGVEVRVRDDVVFFWPPLSLTFSLSKYLWVTNPQRLLIKRENPDDLIGC